MAYNEAISAIAKATGQPKSVVKSILISGRDLMEKELMAGRPVSIKGIGKLEVVNIKGRERHSPRTGEKVFIKGHRAIKFRVSGLLKDALKAGDV